MLGRALKMAFWVTYDHVGKLILANVLWFVAFAVPASLAWGAFATGEPAVRLVVAWPLLIAGVGVVLPVMTAGLAHMAKVLIDKRDGSLGDMFRGIRMYGGRAAGIGLVYFFACASLATSAWFYAVKLHGAAPWLGYAISALAVWALVFVAMTSLMAMPALVQKKGGVVATVKLAALLVLANPLLVLGLALQLAAFTVLSVLVTPLFPLLYGAVAVVLVSSAYELLARKYAAAGAPEGALETGAGPRPMTDEEDDYLNRGFRDFLFPWKG